MTASLKTDRPAGDLADGPLARPRPGRRPRPLRRELLRRRARRQGLRRRQAAPPGLANSVYRNDGQPEPIPGSPPPAWAPLAVAWENVQGRRRASRSPSSPWPGVEAAPGGERPHTGVAALDLDDDRDLDLVLSADGAPPVAVLNDRLGHFHEAVLEDLGDPEPVSGLLVDRPRQGRPPRPRRTRRRRGRVLAWRNTTERTTRRGDQARLGSLADQRRATGDRRRPPTSTSTACPTCSACPPRRRAPASRARRPGPGTRASGSRRRRCRSAWRRPALDGPGAGRPGRRPAARPPARPRRASRPALARNLGNGHHWLALELGGHWRVKPELMRTNSHALGTRVIARRAGGPRRLRPHDARVGPRPVGRPGRARPGQARRGRPGPPALARRRHAVRAERRRPTSSSILAENNRKTGSCPVLFTWNGERFVCLGDFLGGGGLGYLVAPGVYGQPDRDEAVAIAADQLRAERGRLPALDHRADGRGRLSRSADARRGRPAARASRRRPTSGSPPTAPGRPASCSPGGRRSSRSARPTSTGRDVTETLRHWDRRTVDGFRKRDGWIGYAEEHGIVLDFGDRLARFGPDDRLVLCLAGWVEYPYSQTNYAAATAGVALQPPVDRAAPRRRHLGGRSSPTPAIPPGLPADDDARPDRQARPARAACSGSGPTWNATRTRRSSPCRDREAESSLRVTTAPGRPGRARPSRLHPRGLARRPPAARSTITTTSTRPRWPGWRAS